MAPLRYTAKFDPFFSLDCALTHALHPGEIQGKEGIKFCYLATLLLVYPVHSRTMSGWCRSLAQSDPSIVSLSSHRNLEHGTMLSAELRTKSFILTPRPNLQQRLPPRRPLLRSCMLWPCNMNMFALCFSVTTTLEILKYLPMLIHWNTLIRSIFRPRKDDHVSKLTCVKRYSS